MIQINLLPEELRRSTRTPPRTLALLFSATVLCCGGLGTAGFLWFNVRADKQARLDIAQEQLDNLTPGARYVDQLAKEKAEFEKRDKTISEIASSRIVWTRKLDRLADVVAHGGTRLPHRVWLGSIDIDGADGVALKGYSAGPDLAGVSNFQDELMGDTVFKEGFHRATQPQSSLADGEEEFDPPAKREFQFDVQLPPKEKKKSVRKPPAAKPSGS